MLALEHAYHGDTFKAMEVGDDEDYHFAFDKKEGVVHIPTEIPALEEAFEQYHDRLNCFIVEPLLQGAGGMRMYDISFLKRARELCDQYDVLLIFDGFYSYNLNAQKSQSPLKPQHMPAGFP